MFKFVIATFVLSLASLILSAHLIAETNSASPATKAFCALSTDNGFENTMCILRTR